MINWDEKLFSEYFLSNLENWMVGRSAEKETEWIRR